MYRFHFYLTLFFFINLLIKSWIITKLTQNQINIREGNIGFVNKNGQEMARPIKGITRRPTIKILKKIESFIFILLWDLEKSFHNGDMKNKIGLRILRKLRTKNHNGDIRLELSFCVFLKDFD